MKKLKNITRYAFILITTLALTITTSLHIFAEESTIINADNYSENVEAMQKAINGNNTINETSSKEYAFGTYGRVQVDMWDTTITSYEIGEDGYHTIHFKANDGYYLPAQVATGDTRFARIASYTTQGSISYNVNTEEQTATLRFMPKADRDTYNAAPILIRLVGIKNETKEDKYLTDYVFIEVVHKALPSTNEELAAGISHQITGSKTYLIKKNTVLKVYVTDNPYFMPIENTNNTTGINDGSTDFSNRYFVINGSARDRTGDTISYTSTAFNVKVYDYKLGAYVTKSIYDFYHQDNTINMPSVNDENVVFPGYRVTGYKIQQAMYTSTIANKYTWDNKTLGLNDTLTFVASDYNKQWTTSGIDGGYDQYRESSLRHRAGNIFITPVYIKQFNVTFVDFDGKVLDTQVVDKGTTAVAPTSPSRDGFDFTNWDKDFSNVTEDLVVTALYQEKAPEKVTVTFVDYNGNILKTDTIDQGTNAVAPTTPPRTDYRFTGWDKDFTNVQTNLTVTATYEKLPTPEVQLVKVTFIDYDGNLLNAQEVQIGQNAIAPSNPQRQGYTFIGWDKTFTNVQTDLIVTAQYQLNEVVAPITPTQPTTPTTPTLPEGPTTLPEQVLPQTPEITITENETTIVPVTTTTQTTDVVNTPSTIETDIEETAVPLANNDVEINEQNVPLANNTAMGSWALVNLIATVLTVLVGFILIIVKHQKEEETNKENNEENQVMMYVRRRWTKVLAVVIAVISIVAFIFTENMSLPMVLTDRYTLAMVLILLAQVVVLFIGRQWKTTNEEAQTQQQ